MTFRIHQQGNPTLSSLGELAEVFGGEILRRGKHITERYGEIRHTLGTGCSGGAIMQLQLSSLYPQLLDGLQTACTYPDSYSTTLEVVDCGLPDTYFRSTEFSALAAGLTAQQLNAKKANIAGHLDEKGCQLWVSSFGNLNAPGEYVSPRTHQPTNNCQLPGNQIYHSRDNPDGVRCSVPEYALSIWGSLPGSLYLARDNLFKQPISYAPFRSRQISDAIRCRFRDRISISRHHSHLFIPHSRCEL